MNVTESNRFINALNRIAEGATMLACVIEDAAWETVEDHAGMPGARPVAAAELVQPSFEAAASEPQTVPGRAGKQSSHPGPVTDAAQEPAVGVESEVSLGQVRAVLARLSQAGHTGRVRELIEATGADKLSAVEPGKYGWLLSQAEAIADA